MATETVIKKETKNKISVDYEGKLTFKERLMQKLKSSNTWIKVVINIFRFILMIGISYVILFPFFSKIAGSFMGYEDFVDVTVRVIPKNFTFATYKAIFLENNYLEAFLNTTLLSVSSALLQTFVCTLIGYGLAKFKFKGNGLVMILVILTMIVPHETLKLSLSTHFRYFDFGGLHAFLKSDATESEIKLVSCFMEYSFDSDELVCAYSFLTNEDTYKVVLHLGANTEWYVCNICTSFY